MARAAAGRATPRAAPRARSARRPANLRGCPSILPVASDVEPEVHDIAFLDDVGLAFEAELASLAGARFAAPRDERVVGDHLGADEAALEVAVDCARRLRRRCAARHGPGAALFWPGRVEGLQPQQTVRRADHTVQARLRKAEARKELGSFR